MTGDQRTALKRTIDAKIRTCLDGDVCLSPAAQRCTVCDRVQPADGFYAGQRSQCKQCENLARRQWRERNHEREKATDQARKLARRRKQRAA